MSFVLTRFSKKNGRRMTKKALFRLGIWSKRVVIIGSCFSGSFIEKLSKGPRNNTATGLPEDGGRVIITSAAPDEVSYKGPQESFLRQLNMVLEIAEAREDDLLRAEELTYRTNQLNATGRTYTVESLDALRRSGTHKILVCELTDKYGSYGKIGLALLEQMPGAWPKLGGIHKDADHHAVRSPTGFLDKRHVPGMQRSHRWNKADPPPVVPELRKKCPDFRDCPALLHRSRSLPRFGFSRRRAASGRRQSGHSP
jgi:hypothetical protein